MAGAQVAGPLGAPFQPNFTPASPLLTRMYGLHAAVLPIVLVVLLSLHLCLVRHLGVSAAGDASTPFSTHLRPLGGFTLLVVAVLPTPAGAAPPPVLAPGVAGLTGTKPFGAVLWLSAAARLFGPPG